MPLATDDRIVESMFLSPRVVDAATFEELSGLLRTLAQKASERRMQLEQAVVSAQDANQQIDQLGERLKAAVTPAARLVQTLNDRIEKAQQSVQSMLDPESMIRSGLEAGRVQIETALHAQGNDAIDALIARLERRLGELEADAEVKAQARIDRLNEATDACEQRLAHAQASLASSVKATEASIASITRRAVEQQVNELIASRLAQAEEQAIERIRTMTAQAEQKLSEGVREAKQATDQCKLALDEIKPEITKLCGSALDQARQTIEAASADLAVALAKLEDASEQTVAKTQEQTERIHCELLVKLNGASNQATVYAGRTEDSLVGLEARATAIGERLAKRIDELASHAEAVSRETSRDAKTADSPPNGTTGHAVKKAQHVHTLADGEHDITISTVSTGSAKPAKKPSARNARADGTAA